MKSRHVDIAVVGAGIVGLACGYYLARSRRAPKVAIIDPLPPMSLTSAASGENYRNWWPHPVMTEFTDFSTDLMEAISTESDNRLHMTRRGYALATRQAHPDDLLRQLHEGYGAEGAGKIRTHRKGSTSSYQPAISAEWQSAPDGVDVIQDRDILERYFPSFDRDVATVLHIRRAGDISGQQLGSFMLEQIRARDGEVIRGQVVEIGRTRNFTIAVAHENSRPSLTADVVVNVFQQKIAFEDVQGVIGRQMPFSIDLDGQTIDWTAEERAVLAGDPASKWLTEPMPGSIHCRPEGGDRGKGIKVGWAFNVTPSIPAADLPLDPNFPEIVLRGASRLNPGLKAYYGRLPARLSHYGGYYTMTRENWPLIGPMKTDGAFVAGALSGFGTMAACATGALCAGWVYGEALPGFARSLSLARYDDKPLMQSLLEGATGVL